MVEESTTRSELKSRGQVRVLPAVLYHDMYNSQHTEQSAGNQRDWGDC